MPSLTAFFFPMFGAPYLPYVCFLGFFFLSFYFLMLYVTRTLGCVDDADHEMLQVDLLFMILGSLCMLV